METNTCPGLLPASLEVTGFTGLWIRLEYNWSNTGQSHSSSPCWRQYFSLPHHPSFPCNVVIFFHPHTQTTAKLFLLYSTSLTLGHSAQTTKSFLVQVFLVCFADLHTSPKWTSAKNSSSPHAHVTLADQTEVIFLPSPSSAWKTLLLPTDGFLTYPTSVLPLL